MRRSPFIFVFLGLALLFPLNRPLQATILYEDTFDSTRTDCHYDGSTWRVEGGYLKYLPDGGTDSRYWADGMSGVQDYTVEAVGRFPSGTGYGGWATLGRMCRRISGYSLQYDPGHSGYRFFNYTTYHDVAPSVSHSIDTDWHHLMQVFRGDSIFFYVDSVLVATATDELYPTAGWGYGLIAWRLEVWFQYFRVSTKEQINEHRPPEITLLGADGWTSCNPPRMSWRLFDSTGIFWNSLVMRVGPDTITWPDSRLSRVGADTLVLTVPTLLPGDSITACLLELEDWYGNAWHGSSCRTARVDLTAPILSATSPPLYSTFAPPLDSILLTFDEPSGVDIIGALFLVEHSRASARRLPFAPNSVSLTPIGGAFPPGDVEVSYSGLQDCATGCGANTAERFTFYLFAALPYLTAPDCHLTDGLFGHFSVRAHRAYQDADCRLLLLTPSGRLDTVALDRAPVSAETLYIKDMLLHEAGQYRYSYLLTDAAGRMVRDPVDTFYLGPVSMDVAGSQPSAEVHLPRYLVQHGMIVKLPGGVGPLSVMGVDGTRRILLDEREINTTGWASGLYALLARQADGRSVVKAWLLVE